MQKVNLSKVNQEQIDEIANSDEPMKEYYFHFCGKLNQSYVIETPERNAIYTIDCEKVGFLKKSKYTFTNKLSFRTIQYEVSHVLTESYGIDRGFNINAKSTFKMNGTDVFDLIASMGYSITVKIQGLRMSFDVSHYGVKVATLKSAGANVAKADKNYGKLGDIPTQGVYIINARETDLDAIAIIAFAVSRVEFF